MGWGELYAMARTRWHGAFPIAAAPVVGLTPYAVDARARRDPFERPHPGVIIVPGYPADHRTRLMAVQLHLGESAAASDLSAAWLYGLVERAPSRPHLMLPHAQRVTPARTVIRRSRYFEAADRTTVDGISVVTPPFLLVAIAGRATLDTMLGLALDARQRRLLDPAALSSRLETLGRVPGRRKIERLVVELARDGSDSVFESRVRDRLRASGLTPTDTPYAVRLSDGQTVHLDIAFPAARVAIECQGHMAHSTRRQLDRDARRENAIALSGGWLVLKLTWDRFVYDWAGFLTELRAALAARG